MRSRKRSACSSREMCRNSLTTIVPSFARCCSNALMARVALLPDLLRGELLDAHDEHVLVVRAVEDADLAALREHVVDAPEEVVRELGRARGLEAGDAHAHRVEAAERVLDGAVLARGVHALQHDEQCAPVLGHQHRGELRHALEALRRLRARRLLVAEAELGVGRVVVEVDLGAWLDARGVGEILHRGDDTRRARQRAGTQTAPARAGAVRGTAYGIRTRVTGVRGQRPRPLDERGTYPGHGPFYRIPHSTKNLPVSPPEYQRLVTVVLRV